MNISRIKFFPVPEDALMRKESQEYIKSCFYPVNLHPALEQPLKQRENSEPCHIGDMKIMGLFTSFQRMSESSGFSRLLDSGLGFGILRRSASSIRGVVRQNDESEINGTTVIKNIRLIFFAIMLLIFEIGCTSISTDEYMKDARKNYKDGDFNSAVINLKNVLQRESNNLEARLLLGKTYLKIGNGKSAQKELEIAERLGAERNVVDPALAKAYLLQNKPELALDKTSLSDSYSADIKDELLMIRAGAQMLLKQYEAAEKTLNQVLKKNPNRIEALLNKARVLAAQNKPSGAKELILEVLDKKPDNLQALLMMGDISRLQGNVSEAKNSYQKALLVAPDNVSALLANAGIKISDGDFDEALKLSEQVLKTNPDNPLANFLQALAFYKSKNYEKSEHALLKVLRISPEHIPSHQMLGAIYFSDGRLEQARASLEKVVRKMPDNLVPVKLLAATWIKLNEPDAAIKVIERALPEHESDAQLLALLGSAYMRANNSTKGTTYLERAVSLSPENARIQTQLALGRLASGDDSEAVRALEAAVQLGQDVFQADVLLIMTLMKNKEYQKALESARQLAKSKKNDPLPYNFMGAIYYAQGKESQARESFEKALSLKDDFLPSVINLVKLDVQDRNFKSATARLKDQLEKDGKNPDILLELARVSAQAGNHEDAQKWLQQAWASNSGDERVGEVLVKYWLARKDYPKALDVAEAVKKKLPGDFSALRLFGTTQIAAKKLDEALTTFKEIVKIYPDSAMAHYLLGGALVRTSQQAAALKEFKKAISLNSSFVPAYLKLAQIYLRDGKTADALNVARKIQYTSPEKDAGYLLEGNIFSSKKDFSAAMAAYEKGFSKAPSGALAVQYYLASKRIKGKTDTGLLKKWIKRKGDDVAARMMLAQAYTESGDRASAVRQYEKILELSPRNVAALNNVAWLYFETGSKNALTTARKAYELASKNPAVIDTYGWILLQGGSNKQGLELLAEASTAAPEQMDIQYHYAVGLLKNGKKSKAKEKLQDLLADTKAFNNRQEARKLLDSLM